MSDKQPEDDANDGQAYAAIVVDAGTHCARHGDFRVGINKLAHGGWEVFIKYCKVQVWSITSAAKKPVGKTLKETVKYANLIAKARNSEERDGEKLNDIEAKQRKTKKEMKLQKKQIKKEMKLQKKQISKEPAEQAADEPEEPRRRKRIKM